MVNGSFVRGSAWFGRPNSRSPPAVRMGSAPHFIEPRPSFQRTQGEEKLSIDFETPEPPAGKLPSDICRCRTEDRRRATGAAPRPAPQFRLACSQRRRAGNHRVASPRALTAVDDAEHLRTPAPGHFGPGDGGRRRGTRRTARIGRSPRPPAGWDPPPPGRTASAFDDAPARSSSPRASPRSASPQVTDLKNRGLSPVAGSEPLGTRARRNHRGPGRQSDCPLEVARRPLGRVRDREAGLRGCGSFRSGDSDLGTKV
jgi:hypothetical protein